MSCSLLLLVSLTNGAVAPKKTVVDEKIACNSDVHCSLMVKALTALNEVNIKVRTLEKNLTLKLVKNSKQTEKLSALLLFHDGRLKANIDSAGDEAKVITAISEVISKVDKLEKNLNSKADKQDKNLTIKLALNRATMLDVSKQTEKLSAILKSHDETLKTYINSTRGASKLLQSATHLS